jgi:hypothetical protein
MATSGKPGASPNAQAVYNTFRARGYSNAAAAGIVGNLQQESGVSPRSIQPGGAGRGIAQWGTGPGSGGRWETENAYAAAHKQNPWALLTQVNFLQQEMNQRGLGAGSAFAKSGNVANTTSQFQTAVEQSGDSPPYTTRIGYAQNAYSAFSGNPVSASTAPRSYNATQASKKLSTADAAKAGIAAALGKGTKVTGAAGKAFSAEPGAQNPIGQALGTVGNAAGAVGGTIASAAGDVASVPKAIGKITTTIFSVSFWIRVVFILVGLALVFIGTKALLTGSPPQMPSVNTKPGNAPGGNTAPKGYGQTSTKPKKSFAGSAEGDVGEVGEAA